MCGLVGLAGPYGTREHLAHLVTTMAATLVHRGPDGEGQYVDQTSPLALGFRRLAIIDLSPAGDQPMHSRSGRWVIVFNGEIYNHRALRAELQAAGATFRGHSDTETLVEAIEAWGFEATLQRTNGMFAIAAWNVEQRQLLLARDRLGEKPLYWQQAGDRFAFASELRALRTLPDANLTIDPAAATALLRWSYIPHPHTIYTGVRQLPPGGMLQVDLRTGRPVVEERTWWSLADTIDRSLTQRRPITLDDAAAQLEPLLADAVAMRQESDVPLGAFLSGGVDSSLVAAFAQRVNAGNLHTFTVRMPDLGFDESVPAFEVARHLGTDHETIDLSLAEALAHITTLPTVWDEPYADPSMLPTALLCQAARRHLTVCLGGDGGDELFAGYNRHALGARFTRRTSHLPRSMRHALGRLLMMPSPSGIDSFARGISHLLPASRRLPNLGDKVQKAGMMLAGNGSTWETLAQVWPPEHLAMPALQPDVPTLGPALNPALDPVEQMMLADTSSVLPDQMLVKVDRASMAASLEVRVPFLDHRILEWSWQQPVSVKTAGGVGKLVLRRVAERMLPDEIVNRPKMGFDPPLGRWLRDELKPWAGDLLAAPRSVSEGWLHGPALQQVWQEHLSGRRNWEYRLWGVLMLESWLAEHHSP